ncbi:MAG: arylsulfatase [Lentisphaeraceae bacterium]|nr:arylsulfatase [Lentisphaeraceae bacterium]
MKVFNILVMTLFLGIHLQAELKGKRPNIILVMTDDQGMGDLSCMGNKVLATPHIDSIFASSTRFKEFHVSPTCAPSRAAIFSGRHPFKNGVTHTILERERMALSSTTFPQLLQKGGYATGIFGKWHLGDEQEYQPESRGFGEVFVHGAGGVGQKFKSSCADYPPNWDDKNKYFDIVVKHNKTLKKTKGFCTDVFFKAALGWIKEKNEEKKPFFAYISTNAPHGPMLAPKEDKEKFKKAGWDANTAGRYGMIENIDDNVGVLLQKMKEWKLEKNTLLIFMTDNGQAGRTGKLKGKKIVMHSAGFKTGKNTPYEGGTHVPAFWSWKGVLKEGVDIPALTAHIDMYKTFCELAGVDIPENIQELEGRSLLPLLKDPKSTWADRELFIHVARWKKGQDPNKSKFRGSAIRTQRWRFVHNKELYDIQNDPFETKNVADAYPEVIAELRKKYDIWWESTLPFMVNEDVPLLDYRPAEVHYNKQLKESGIPNWEEPEL